MKKNKLQPDIVLMDYLFTYEYVSGHMLRGIIKPCKECGKLIFVTISKLKKNKNHFCNLDCFYKFTTIGYYNICPVCGKEFWVTPKNKKEGSDKHCSRACSAKAQENKVIQYCLFCGKEIVTTPARIKENRDKYCSKECYYNSMKKREIITCPTCKKEFEVKDCELNRGGGIYCSRECASKGNSGVNNYMWKNGASFNPYCEKFNNKRREIVREFYGRICFICGKTEEENGRRLPVHHVDADKEQGCNGKSWELVPLCTSCHGKMHGKKNEEYWRNYLRTAISWRLIQT